MPSPYPWHYTIRWPFYFRWPSMKNHTNIVPVPDYKEFSPPHKNSIRLLFCGDIMVQNGDKIPRIDSKLADLIQTADLFVGNCEGPVGEHACNSKLRYNFLFHLPREYLTSIIKQTGLPAEKWCLSTTNNHTGDRGYEACLDSIEILNALKITPLGRYFKDRLPLEIKEIRGKRFGFAAWTNWMNCEIFPPDDLGGNRLQDIMSKVWSHIKKEHKLDYLFGIPHWEYEFQHFPHKSSRSLAKTLIDEMGFDFLVGVHSHTLQPMEWFDKGFCVYSLGNFCGLGVAWSIKLITVLELVMNPDETGKKMLSSYKLHYFFQHHDEKNQVHIIPLSEAPADKKEKILQRLPQLYQTTRNS